MKVLCENGGYKYATAERAEKGMSERFIRILAESVLSIESAVNLIVIKTIAASAQAAAEAIDSLKWPELLGTIAGDNTILVIARSEEAVENVVSRFTRSSKDSEAYRASGTFHSQYRPDRRTGDRVRPGFYVLTGETGAGQIHCCG